MLLEEEYPLMIMKKEKISGLEKSLNVKPTKETAVNYWVAYIWPQTATM